MQGQSRTITVSSLSLQGVIYCWGLFFSERVPQTMTLIRAPRRGPPFWAWRGKSMHALHLARQTRIPYPTNHIAHPFPLVEVDPISFMHVYVLRTGSFCIPRVSLRELISFFEVLISPLPLRSDSLLKVPLFSRSRCPSRRPFISSS